MSVWTEFSFVLGASSIAGVGVFTTHDIPVGACILNAKFNFRTQKISDVPEPFLKYCIFIDHDHCICPERFDRMEIGWYINHSHQPNIGKNEHRELVAIRHIDANEELLLDYNDLNEPEHLKEDYYRVSNLLAESSS